MKSHTFWQVCFLSVLCARWIKRPLFIDWAGDRRPALSKQNGRRHCRCRCRCRRRHFNFANLSAKKLGRYLRCGITPEVSITRWWLTIFLLQKQFQQNWAICRNRRAKPVEIEWDNSISADIWFFFSSRGVWVNRRMNWHLA